MYTKLLSSMLLLVICCVQVGCGGSQDKADRQIINTTNPDTASSPESSEPLVYQAKQMVNELQNWQTVIDLKGDQSLIDNDLMTASQLANDDMKSLMQAVSIAGQWATLTGIPEVAGGFACQALGDPLTVLLCEQLLDGENLDQLCDLALKDVKVFGLSLCEIMNDLTFPVGDGIVINFHLLDKYADFSGEIGGNAVDLTIISSDVTDDSLTLSVQGTITTETGLLTISEGSIVFQFANGISTEQLTLPETATTTLTIAFEQQDPEVADPIYYEGTITATVNYSELLENYEANLFNLDNLVFEENLPIDLDFALQAVLSTDSGKTLESNWQLGTSGNESFKLNSVVRSDDQSLLAELELSGDLENYLTAQPNLELSYQDTSISVQYLSNHLLNIENEKGITMTLDLLGQGNVGEISLLGAVLGTIEYADGVYWVHFTDGSSVAI